MSAVALGPVSAHVRERVRTLLGEQRLVVWYDPQIAFAGLLDTMSLPHTVTVSAAGSVLQARGDAEGIYRHYLLFTVTACYTDPKMRGCSRGVCVETYYGVVQDGRVVLDAGVRPPAGVRVEVRPRAAQDIDADLLARLRAAGLIEGNDPRRGPAPFEPVEVEGIPLSDEIIRNRR